MSKAGPPAGYRESAVGRTALVSREALHEAFRDALKKDTLHRWAYRQPGARPLQGREVVWATQLPDGTKVAVRHSRHGGALAAVTGDRFLAPSRAPHELRTALQLQAAGVPTPDVLGYAVYSAIWPFVRTDVVTALVDGADWPAAWAAAHSPAVRDGIIDAVAAVLRTLQKANAVHPDLNVKNILISEAGGAPVAFVLDVDRVRRGTGPASDTGRRNAGRLHTSIAKWRSMRGLDISPSQMDRLMHGAGVPWTGQ